MSLNYKEGKPIVTLGKKTIYVEEKPGETTSIKLTGKMKFFYLRLIRRLSEKYYSWRRRVEAVSRIGLESILTSITKHIPNVKYMFSHH